MPRRIPHAILLLILLPAAAALALPSEKPQSAPVRAEPSPAPEGPSPEGASPAGRRILIDSRVEFQKPEGEPFVLDTPEVRLIRQISLHTGGALCLWLADPPSHQGPLFHPGYSVPLDRKKKEEEKAGAEARQAKQAQEQAEAERRGESSK